MKEANMKTKKHVCKFIRSRGDATVDICQCGRFQHNENNRNEVIIERTQMQHSPTPWKVQNATGYDNNGKSVTYQAIMANDDTVLDDDLNNMTPENKVFIVRTVNAHEQLLAAAKQALSWLDPYGDYIGNVLDDNSSGKEIVVFELYEAIAKAEGK